MRGQVRRRAKRATRTLRRALRLLASEHERLYTILDPTPSGEEWQTLQRIRRAVDGAQRALQGAYDTLLRDEEEARQPRAVRPGDAERRNER